jgi:hypothetical protein
VNPTVTGALIGIGGIIVGSLLTYFLQVRMIRHALRRARTEDLHEKRLVALQNMIFACDWILRMKDHTMIDTFGKEIWDHVLTQNLSNLTFVPESFRQDFDAIIRALFTGHALENRNKIEYDSIAQIRTKLLRYIDEQFEEKRTLTGRSN